MRNYYDILGVPKNASGDDIRKAYKKLAIAFHPDKNGGSDEAKQKFQEISEAYEVLSDDEKRKIFDMYGEDGLKGGGMPGGSGGMPFVFKTSSGGAPFNFTSHDPSEIFKQFFGTNNPFDAENQDSPFVNIGGFPNQIRQRRQKKNSPIEKDFECSLEELYNGTTKKMCVTRQITDENGSKKTEKKVLEIPIKPGFKEGTKITFEKSGDQMPNVIPADIIFKLKEKAHPIFKRDGDDLIMKETVTIEDVLTGNVKVLVNTLNNRKFYVKIPSITHPNYMHIVKNEGMPKKTTGTFGDLYIKFDIKFPKNLTQKQKDDISNALKGASY